ncbi:hypothetical protein [Nostoc sp. UHCC 0870]|uniref:hypothetical protein n=1 Tax=Nostoc sp. UHCC 0870 TaxID=2914041 RepID=UPI001EDF9596|nr:hypothetical protein [Nostoc sp. UHCC 0870]UKO99378.1 hypothetical protein L6494_06595 [Nostoc sp. UHCC 0870]
MYPSDPPPNLQIIIKELKTSRDKLDRVIEALNVMEDQVKDKLIQIHPWQYYNLAHSLVEKDLFYIYDKVGAYYYKTPRIYCEVEDEESEES